MKQAAFVPAQPRDILELLFPRAGYTSMHLTDPIAVGGSIARNKSALVFHGIPAPEADSGAYAKTHPVAFPIPPTEN